MPPVYRRLLVGYAVLGAALWTTPLLSILHVESSAIVATAAFFAVGVTMPALERGGIDQRRIILMHEGALLVPWLFLTASLIWQPNCGYLLGLLFYVIFPGITVVFAVSLQAVVHELGISRPILLHTTIGVFILIAGPVHDLGFHPQFYTYNHVFGGALGPIYDEQLSVRPGLFAFRLLTIFWAVLCFFIAAYLRREGTWIPCALTAIVIAACYAWAPRLGMVTTHQIIQEELGSVRYTQNFEIYYDSDVMTPQQIDAIAEDHEFRYVELAEKLNSTISGRITSYVYPDADTKGQLTGARRTNVAPVWLDKPQTHVLFSAFDRVFPHELVHVFSREFGLPIINASVSVGLVEGLAVAAEPPSGAPSAHELVSAALLSEGTAARGALARSGDLSESIASRLSPFGFWTGRGAVSYTAMGSFAAYLIDTYGIEPFKRAYPWAGFEEAYGKSVRSLAEEWVRYVLSLDAVSRSSQDVVTARFAVPSLFEKDCPHHIPRYRRLYSGAESALIRRDTVAALTLITQALDVRPDYRPALELWAGISLRRGDALQVAERLNGFPRDSLTTLLQIRLADAFAMLGLPDSSRVAYARAVDRLPAFAYEAKTVLRLRIAAADSTHFMRRFLSSTPSADGPITPSQRALIALVAARDGAFEQAFNLLRTTALEERVVSEPFGRAFMRQRLAWLAQFAYQSGLHAEAFAYADSAAAAYRAAGAFNEANVLLDLQNRIRWKVDQGLERIAGDTNRPHRAEAGSTTK